MLPVWDCPRQREREKERERERERVVSFLPPLPPLPPSLLPLFLLLLVTMVFPSGDHAVTVPHGLTRRRRSTTTATPPESGDARSHRRREGKGRLERVLSAEGALQYLWMRLLELQLELVCRLLHHHRSPNESWFRNECAPQFLQLPKRLQQLRLQLGWRDLAIAEEWAWLAA
jgi:hypothetical protein